MKFINWPSRCAEVKGHFVQTISLDLMKSSEVRKAGDRSKFLQKKSLILPALSNFSPLCEQDTLRKIRSKLFGQKSLK